MSWFQVDECGRKEEMLIIQRHPPNAYEAENAIPTPYSVKLLNPDKVCSSNFRYVGNHVKSLCYRTKDDALCAVLKTQTINCWFVRQVGWKQTF